MDRGEAITQEGDVHLGSRETLNSWSQVESRIELHGNNQNNSLDHCSPGPSVSPRTPTTITTHGHSNWHCSNTMKTRKLMSKEEIRVPSVCGLHRRNPP